MKNLFRQNHVICMWVTTNMEYGMKQQLASSNLNTT